MIHAALRTSILGLLLAGAAYAAETAPVLKPYQSWEEPVAFSFPEGWTVIEEGQSIFFAPKPDQIMWESYDARTQAMYVAGRINPFLTLTDQAADRVRPMTEFAQATIQSLMVTEGLKQDGPIASLQLLNGSDAVSFLLSSRTRYHYQYIVHLTRRDVAIVSANGPKAQLARMKSIVDAVARSARPAKDPSKP